MNMIKLLLLCAIAMLTACSSLPKDYQAEPTYYLTDTDDTWLGRRASAILGDNPEQTAAYLVNEGTDAFFARMALLAYAEKSIDVQYFIWHADLIGKLLFQQMILAADRGVRVRVLLDDINVDAEVESMLYAMDQHENIEVRLYNPFATRGFRMADFITDGFRMNRRMHNKSFTVDNQVTIVGGRNIGDEYFSADEESNFNDIDVVAVGPVVADIAQQFDTYWNSNVVVTVSAFEHNEATLKDLDDLRKELAAFKQSKTGSKYQKDIQDSSFFRNLKNSSNKTAVSSEMIFNGDIDVIYDDPEKTIGKSHKEVDYLSDLMKPHLQKINTSFEIISPYFVPGDKGTGYLTEAVKKGIKVRLLTNSLSSTDGLMAQSGYSRQRIDLLKGGVEIYELKAHAKTKASRSLRRSAKAKSGLHAKTYIFDREEIFIGSFNFDQRSANINTEVGVIYQMPEMAEFIAKSVFEKNILEAAYRVELVIEHEVIDGIKIAQEKVVWIEMKDGKEIRHTKDPATSGWRRFNEDIFSILPIESQL